MGKITKLNQPEPSADNGTSEPIGTEANSSGNNIAANSGNSGNDSGNSADNGSGNFEFVNSEEKPAKRGRGRPRKDGNTETKQTSTKSKSKQKVNDSEKAAKFLMQRVEKFSEMLLHKDTAFNEEETFLIQPSLSSILDEMNFDAVEKYSKILNPVLLVFGLILWYMRIAPVQTKPIRVNKVAVNDNQNGAVPTANDTITSIYTEKRDDNPFAQSIAH